MPSPRARFPQPFAHGLAAGLPHAYWKGKLLGRQRVRRGSLGEERRGAGSRQSAAVRAPRSRASNGKRLLSVTVNQIGEIRGLFA